MNVNELQKILDIESIKQNSIWEDYRGEYIKCLKRWMISSQLALMDMTSI